MAESIEKQRTTEAIVRRVSECATASLTEADFVHRLHEADFLISPGWSSWGDQLTVLGYTVAAPPHDGNPSTWYRVSDFNQDLSLFTLRQSWETSEELEMQAWNEWERHSVEPLG